jgi:hypothetical protein
VLSAYLASTYLSPNGYLAYTVNHNSLLPSDKHKNFLEEMNSRLVVQNSLNMSASRSFQAYLESSLDLSTTQGGVIYQNATVNALFLGLVNTAYNRKRFPSTNPYEWLPLEGIATLIKMWSSGDNRPECGAFVGFRVEGKKAKVVFPEYY